MYPCDSKSSRTLELLSENQVMGKSAPRAFNHHVSAIYRTSEANQLRYDKNCRGSFSSSQCTALISVDKVLYSIVQKPEGYDLSRFGYTCTLLRRANNKHILTRAGFLLIPKHLNRMTSSPDLSFLLPPSISLSESSQPELIHLISLQQDLTTPK